MIVHLSRDCTGSKILIAQNNSTSKMSKLFALISSRDRAIKLLYQHIVYLVEINGMVKLHISSCNMIRRNKLLDTKFRTKINAPFQ